MPLQIKGLQSAIGDEETPVVDKLLEEEQPQEEEMVEELANLEHVAPTFSYFNFLVLM